MKYQKTTITDLEKQRDEITSLFISGKHDKKFLNSEMDKSGVDLSLLDELFMLNSILAESSNITEGTEKHEVFPDSR